MHRITLRQADVSTLAVHATGNAASQFLLDGGGVDGAIHPAAGPVADGLGAVSLPTTSCGIYRYPIRKAARIAVDRVTTRLAVNRLLRKVIFTCLAAETFAATKQLPKRVQPDVRPALRASGSWPAVSWTNGLSERANLPAC